MCRIAMVPAVTDANRDDVWLMLMSLGEIMSRGNNDGLGYAAFDKSGNIFGERWLKNDDAFTDFTLTGKWTPEKIEKNYNFFGEKVLRGEAQAIILHARAATHGGKSLKNTHPFVNDEKVTSAIIHNGVIANHEDFEKKTSTCDSEVLVHLYEKYNVKEKLANVRLIVDQLNGWFTVLNLAKDNTGKMIVDLYTDAPRICSYFVKELNTRVYSTSAPDIIEAADLLGFTVSEGERAKTNMAYRFDALTGMCIESEDLMAGKINVQKFIDFLKEVNKKTKYIDVSDDEKFKQNFLNKVTDV